MFMKIEMDIYTIDTDEEYEEFDEGNIFVNIKLLLLNSYIY